MQLKMFVAPIKNLGDAEAEMNGFLRGHRVLAIKKEFVPDGENSFWTFCVEYLDGTAASTAGGHPGARAPKVDYKAVLKPEEFEVFRRLRDWRKATADKEGVPVYVVLHHALMNVCEPVLERAAIFDSYACRKGRGQQAAVQRAASYAREYGWTRIELAGRAYPL